YYWLASVASYVAIGFFVLLQAAMFVIPSLYNYIKIPPVLLAGIPAVMSSYWLKQIASRGVAVEGEALKSPAIKNVDTAAPYESYRKIRWYIAIAAGAVFVGFLTLGIIAGILTKQQIPPIMWFNLFLFGCLFLILCSIKPKR